MGANRCISAPHASPPDCWQWEEGEQSPPLSPPWLWQGKGEEHFLLDPWYDGLEGESYDGLEEEPKTIGRIRSMVVEPKGQEANFHCRMQWARNKRR